ncbi:hypothetical protein E1258_04785 [Micromonospora sp. KC207]|uniref:hypothetical protein n=1 Tax=Micromonospora sp. KC207 TaxID=2530377 RepID=UPI00104D484F|nr:hypothetical protein [Micromonospora sp. KC207]TDC65768.1 hypothetical protein E1258_04785 [Micromonospora sp. KC207]
MERLGDDLTGFVGDVFRSLTRVGWHGAGGMARVGSGHIGTEKIRALMCGRASLGEITDHVGYAIQDQPLT